MPYDRASNERELFGRIHRDVIDNFDEELELGLEDYAEAHPVDTSQTWSVALAGCGATWRTAATTRPFSSDAPSPTRPASMPAIVSRSAAARGSSVVSTNSRSQR